MGAVPTTDNVWADLVAKIIDAAFTGGAKGVEALIATQVPVLEGPILGIVTNQIIEGIASGVSQNMQKIAANLVIDIQTYGESSAALKAVNGLKSAQAGGNKDEIQAASDAFDKAMGDLIHYDGSLHV